MKALRQYNAQYDEAKRLSDGSDTCWSHPGNDSNSEAVLEVDIESLPMGGAGEGGSQRGEMEVSTMRQGDSLMEVTPVEAFQTMTLAVW